MDAPKYLWHLVAKWLSPEDIARLSMSCTSFRDYFNDQNFWKQKCFADLSDSPSFFFMLDEEPKRQYIDYYRFHQDVAAAEYPHALRVACDFENERLRKLVIDELKNDGERRSDWSMFGTDGLQFSRIVGLQKLPFRISFIDAKGSRQPIRMFDGLLIVAESAKSAHRSAKEWSEKCKAGEARPAMVVLCSESEPVNLDDVDYVMRETLFAKWKRRCDQLQELGEKPEKTFTHGGPIPAVSLDKSPSIWLRTVLEELIWVLKINKETGKVLSLLGQLNHEKKAQEREVESKCEIQ